MEESKEKSFYSPGYGPEDLKQYISQSKWSSKCGFIKETTDITELCHEFLTLLHKPSPLEDVAELITAIYMLMLLDKTKLSWFQAVDARLRLRRHTHNVIKRFKAEDLPKVTKVVWKGLKLDDRSSLQNILDVSRNLATCSAAGSAMPMTLIWMTISSITQIEPKLREFSELASILESHTTNTQRIDAHLDYILIQCLNTLLLIITDTQNQDLKESGWDQYFNFYLADMEKVLSWVNKFVINSENISPLVSDFKIHMAAGEIAHIIMSRH